MIIFFRQKSLALQKFQNTVNELNKNKYYYITLENQTVPSILQRDAFKEALIKKKSIPEDKVIFAIEDQPKKDIVTINIKNSEIDNFKNGKINF